MSDERRHSVDELDKRIYDVMGKKLYEAHVELNQQRPVVAMASMLSAMDDCYALLATLFDSPEEPND